MIGALLTSLYTFRLIFRVFFGPIQTPVSKRPGYTMTVPLVILAFFAVVGGCCQGTAARFCPIDVAGHGRGERRRDDGTLSEIVAALAFLSGLYFAYLFHLQKRSLADAAVGESGR